MAQTEIERKFLVKRIPEHLEQYPFHTLEQGYLNTDPVVRVRREDDSYYLTYKGRGFLVREEYNLPLNADAYAHLVEKADGNIIRKKRYLIPVEGSQLTIELDVFDTPFAPLILAEVEFESIEQAQAFVPPEWFGEDVTENREYSNSNLSKKNFA
ncbi:MAG: CYTH domain-containing protein [Lachnospiraceae bacterium]|nr:CYTH domain-containing protein [Lachnospiraceae bacterium]